MSRKVNTPKFILSVVMVALMVIGSWASTTARLSTVSKGSNTRATSLPTAATPQLAPVVCPPAVPPALCNTFEIEGNAVDDSGFPGLPEDWNDVLSSGETNAVGPQGFISGKPTTTSVALTRAFTNDLGGADQIFTQGGSKDFNDLDQWHHTTGSVPDKDEITHGGAAKYHDPTTGHDVLVFFADRFDNSGDSNIGFWFFQNAISVNPDGTFSGRHSNGDIFVLSAFTKGGGTSTIRVLEWVASPANTAASVCSAAGGIIDPKSDSPTFPQGSLCDITGIATSVGTGIVNGGQITVNWPYSQKGGATCNSGPCTIPQAGLFYEGGIDLTALNLGGECFASFLLETRSSADVSAVLKDYALGGFQQCQLQCNKTAMPTTVCAGGSTTYTYTVTNPGAIALTVSVVDDNGTPGVPGDDFSPFDSSGSTTGGHNPASTTFTLAAGATATCTLTVNNLLSTVTNSIHVSGTAGGTTLTCDSSATVTVNPNPSCTVSPSSAAVCAGATQQFCANVTGGTAPYTYSWNTGDTTSCITVGAAGMYSVTVTDAKGCVTMCSATLVVNPNPTCTVTLDHSAVCAGGSATFTANPVGGSGSYSFLWDTGATTQSIMVTNAQSTVTHSVTITDTKGCTTSCMATLTVNPNPTVSINSATCNANATTVTLTATPSGGGGGFTFKWSGGSTATTSSITVGPGTYTVTVTDSNGCTATATRKVGVCTD